MIRFSCFVLPILLLTVLSTSYAKLHSRAVQLANLRNKLAIVYMWGWSPQEMIPALKANGFQVVHAPHGNDITGKATEVEVWSASDLEMIARPFVEVKDIWDEKDVEQGCQKLQKVIRYYDKNPKILGFALAWGLYGEGGFPHDYEFSDKAREAFNSYMKTPGQPLPDPPKDGIPGSMRWVKWLEFRSKALRSFRRTYITAAKQATNKLVGTWSEFYPIENYQLNMGEAPGADFLLYDLSFGSVTTDQCKAFAECHGDMQHYESYEKWLNHELPLMAKAVGEGVVPMGFQFPMRRGHAADFLTPTTVFTDRVEDEYSIRSGPEMRRLMEAAREKPGQPEVALFYHSFAAAALPGGSAFWVYQPSARQIEGMLHQMGVDMNVLPYEHLESADLSRYKLVIIPDPMYLSDSMRHNLQKAKRVLYCGEFLLTHHDPHTAKGDFNVGWSGVTALQDVRLRYERSAPGQLRVNTRCLLMKDVSFPKDVNYPADQMVLFDPLPKDAEVALRVGDKPAILICRRGKIVHVTNRMFCHAWHAEEDDIERALFVFLRNLLRASGVKVRITDDALVRVKEGFPYGPYGITGHIAWNVTGKELKLHLSNGKEVTVPGFGWSCVPD